MNIGENIKYMYKEKNPVTERYWLLNIIQNRATDINTLVLLIFKTHWICRFVKLSSVQHLLYKPIATLCYSKQRRHTCMGC